MATEFNKSVEHYDPQAALRMDEKPSAPAQVQRVDDKPDNSETILSARGCIYRVHLTQRSVPGMYSIDELNRYLDFSQRSGDQRQIGDGRSYLDFQGNGDVASPLLITGIEFSQQDIVSQMPCLNNFKTFYSFGQNFGNVSIAGEILIGAVGSASTDFSRVKAMIEFWNKYRSSNFKKPIAVSAFSEKYFVYLVGLRIGQAMAEFNILPFVMVGVLLDISKETVSKINPKSEVFSAGGIEDSSLFKALTVRNANSNLVTPTVQASPTTSTSSTTNNVGAFGSPMGPILMKKANQDPLTKDEEQYDAIRQSIWDLNNSYDFYDRDAQKKLEYENMNQALGNRIMESYQAPSGTSSYDNPYSTTQALEAAGRNSKFDTSVPYEPAVNGFRNYGNQSGQ